MSGKTNKKFKKAVRHLWAEYWIKSDKLPFRDRLYIAWRIIKGRDKLFGRKRK